MKSCIEIVKYFYTVFYTKADYTLSQINVNKL